MFTACNLQAQFNLGEFEDIEKLKDIPLLVVLETPNPKKVKKLEKKNPEELKNYLTAIEGKNKALKETFKYAWGISKDVRFVDTEGLSTYKMKENHGKFAYLTTKVYDKVKWKESKTGYLAYTNYSIFILGDVTPLYTKRYASEYSPKSIIGVEDMQLAFGQMKSKFQYKETLMAKRMAKRALKEDIRTAKNTFSDDDE
jgi:hypothetical protein